MTRKVGRLYCVDPRGPEALALVDKAYNFTCPGGTLAFVANEKIREGKLEEIRLVNLVLGPLEVLIIEDHWDSQQGDGGCAAYHALLKDDSQQAHEERLRQARDLILADQDLAHLEIILQIRDLDTGDLTTVEVERPAAMTA